MHLIDLGLHRPLHSRIHRPVAAPPRRGRPWVRYEEYPSAYGRAYGGEPHWASRNILGNVSSAAKTLKLQSDFAGRLMSVDRLLLANSHDAVSRPTPVDQISGKSHAAIWTISLFLNQ